MQILILTLLTTLWSNLALAGQVTLVNPSFQGHPILSHTPALVYGDSEIRAHMTCRLAGYARAALSYHSPFEVKASYAALVRPNIEVFDPVSVTDNKAMQWWMLKDPEMYRPVTLDIDVTKKPKFYRHKKVHPCAEVAVCRGYDPTRFKTDGIMELNTDHPFVQSCFNWGTRSRDELMVFSTLTCETNENVRWQNELGGMARTYLAAHPEFKIETGDPDQMGTRLADTQTTCAKYPRAVQGSLRVPQVGDCDYQPWQPRWGAPKPIMDESFLMYLILTGRFRKGAHPGPACIGKLIDTYYSSVIPEEYQLGELPKHMKLPFCVESVTAVNRNSNQGCAFSVKTRDMLNMAGQIDINFDTEGGQSSGNRCDELAACFSHQAFSCAQANFCPTPGTINRGHP